MYIHITCTPTFSYICMCENFRVKRLVKMKIYMLTPTNPGCNSFGAETTRRILLYV
jgi:hypothetical protein